MKSVLISIQPERCELISSGKKTIEVRKTKPKVKTPFKVYIYCTKDSKNLIKGDISTTIDFVAVNGGKVIGEFVCDKIIYAYEGCYVNIPRKEAQLDAFELMDYANGKPVYGWHISDLVIYDAPKELSEFCRECDYEKDCGYCQYLYVENTPSCYETWCEVDGHIPLTKPPQSWCYVE